MGIQKTLGGNRLGSGGKMKIELKAYERSTHNLSYDWKSSMNVGTLVPFMKFLALNGDTFDINLNALVKTKPTIAPLYGSFKMQLDVFSIPIRLYNGLLHNNSTSIGLKMNQVYLPKMVLKTNIGQEMTSVTDGVISNSHLLKYFGISGIGTITDEIAAREFNAVPILAYYDICKCYYANKQETNAYIITNADMETKSIIKKIGIGSNPDTAKENAVSLDEFNGTTQSVGTGEYLYIEGEKLNPENIWGGDGFWSEDSYTNLTNLQEFGQIAIEESTSTEIIVSFADPRNGIIDMYTTGNSGQKNEKNIVEFPLANIDEMRYKILNNTGLGRKFTIDQNSDLPYRQVVDPYAYHYPQNGLFLKTYQSDMFNNWLSSETIDGFNGISQVTAVSTESGSFTMDALNLAQKVYNMLNLIAASGGTYEDWQEARYGTDAMKRAETPIYEGGASYEIGFEEVVSTADTSTSAAGEQPLGTLAGKGQIFNKDGGKVTIKVKEPSYIIGIVSITPRINYSQGNEWDMYSIDTLEDLHAPELDGIGFQDLIQEQMAYWTTIQNGPNWEQKSAGKQPAWLNYMTNVSKVYGDFADENKAGYMVLDRRYERGADENGEPNDEIKDLTTYIDPTKYNYAFAVSEQIEEQNFWVQIAVNVTARRKMSAKIMPLM